jgi:hypothetical protein
MSPSNEFSLKRLVTAEIWCDRLFGEVEFTLSYRVDSDPCPRLWHKWKKCTARTSCEDVNNPICYPLTPGRESYVATMMMPKPPTTCESVMGRPADVGYQFQLILQIKGYCRIRGFLLHAEPVEKELFKDIVC